MPVEILVALIAFIGVVLSVLASLFASLRATRTEVEKLRGELQQTYTGKLLERRLDTYPDLYKLISDFLKEIQFGTLTKPKLDKLLTEIIEWDSSHAIFLSMSAGSKLYDFRKKLSTELASTIDETLTGEEFLKDMRKQIEELEVALKNDLGIYVVEFSDFNKRTGYYRNFS